MEGFDRLNVTNQFVTHEVCNIKHEQVSKLEETVEQMQKTFNSKLDKIMMLMLTLLVTIITTLLGGVITLLVMYHQRESSPVSGDGIVSFLKHLVVSLFPV